MSSRDASLWGWRTAGAVLSGAVLSRAVLSRAVLCAVGLSGAGPRRPRPPR
ncbi:pentapeptide repeat-containing protein [Streptomyces milbemycinicus]|uniref:pentapeptide repeat-containing protein n=1 Tax=Streptomyces milbemycinicus TaxID=476552 RepID=UPI00340F77DC